MLLLKSIPRFPLFQLCSVLGLCGLLLACGCGGKGQLVVNTFERAPVNWVELSAGGARAPAKLRVASHYLGLSGSRVILAPDGFEDFHGVVDLAVAGGAPKGFAGVFLKRAGDEHFYCFALRPWGTGEFRYYATQDPLRPAGGSGWQSTKRDTPAGYVRLGFEFADGSLHFSLDDERFTPDFGSVLSRAKATGPWQVGIFSVELDTRWNNFIASDNSTAVDFDDLADWGDRSTAAGLEREFTDGARVFLERPTRSSIFALAASLSGAENIYRQLGAKARHEKLSASAAGLLDPLKLAARGLGEEDLLVRCFAMGASSASDRRRILGAGGTDFSALGDRFAGRSRFAEAAVYYAAALSIKDDPRLVGKLAEVKGKIPVPSYSLEIDEVKVRNRVVAQSRFRTAVQGTYGGLPRQDDGDLRIRVQIKRSSASTDAEPATRRVPILVGGGGMSAPERRELERLESDLPEFLLDAKARAEVRRLSSQLGGVDEARGALDAYTIGNMKYELHIDDGKRALKDHARLSALRAKWDGLKSKLSYEEIEAERTTVSINFSAVVELVYRGQILVAAGELSAYRGLVLWLHDAVAEKGIEGSALSKDDIRPAAEAVRRRVLGQFAGHISKAKLLAKLGRQDRLALLLRLARASGNTEDILSLRWYLGRDFEFKEVLCDEVSGRLLN